MEEQGLLVHFVNRVFSQIKLGHIYFTWSSNSLDWIISIIVLFLSGLFGFCQYKNFYNIFHY